MPHLVLRIPSGAPPPSVVWPHPLPPVGCHRTQNCPRVPLTYQAASTAHLVTILLFMLVHRQLWYLACWHKWAHQGVISSSASMNLVLSPFHAAGGKATPSSSTPAAASPPPSLSDEFPPVSLPRSTASPPCKVLFWRMTFSIPLMRLTYFLLQNTKKIFWKLFLSI